MLDLLGDIIVAGIIQIVVESLIIGAAAALVMYILLDVINRKSM